MTASPPCTAALLLLVALAANIKANSPDFQTCSPEFNGLLANDPQGNEQAFLRCQGATGQWLRQSCPGDLVFDFVNQQCATPERKPRQPQRLNIAILNNSCARGEQCIGGTVCDQSALKCLCPPGTTPQLETLSCIKAGPRQPPPTIEPFAFLQQKVGPTISGVASFFPNPAVQNFINELFKPHTAINTMTNDGIGLPRPNNNFVFQSFTTTTPVSMMNNKKIVGPGGSCRDGETCAGGSICTAPLGMCLCPGDLEAHGGECVAPPEKTHPSPPLNAIKNVPLGGVCIPPFSQCAADGADCVSGRCVCTHPFVPHEGRCVLVTAIQPAGKPVGPGEPCDEGEVCTRGSVCDSVIPVCVCPHGTDLAVGECVPVDRVPGAILPAPAPAPAQGAAPGTLPPPTLPPTRPSLLPAAYSSIPYKPAAPSALPAAPIVTLLPSPSTLPPSVRPALPLSLLPAAPAPAPATAPTTTSSPPITYRVPPPQQPLPPSPTSKPNHMKIQLGGSKQAGVGVACALNTDCMIGAYCNGNTVPPSCQCLSTHVNVEGRCEKVIYPGQLGCNTDRQCAAAYTGASCIDRACVCPAGSRAVDQTCVPEREKIGFRCELHALPSDAPTRMKRMLPACSNGAACVRHRCRCPPGTTEAGEHCMPMSGVTDNMRPRRDTQRVAVRDASMLCWPGAEACAGGRGVCIGNICHCAHGYVERGGACVADVVPLGGFCEERTPGPRCAPDALCVGGICRCRVAGGCHNDDNVGTDDVAIADSPAVTRRIRMPDERCSAGDECAHGALCTDGICRCPDGAQLKDGTCHAVSGAYIPIGGACAQADRCSGGSTCVRGVCSCTDGASETAGRCVQHPGGHCRNGESCVGGAACDFGVCRCLAGHVLSKTAPGAAATGGRCVPATAAPGESCQLGQHCATGSACRFGVCMCLRGQWQAKGRCVRKASLVDLAEKSAETLRPRLLPGDSCEGDGKDVCSGGSECHKGVCLCQGENDVVVDNTCIRTTAPTFSTTSSDVTLHAVPGQPCAVSVTECVGGSSCDGGFCSCPDGAAANDDGMCASPVETSTTQQAPLITEASAAINSTSSENDGGTVPAFLASLEPGTRCTSRLECPYATECVRDVCRCAPGYTIVGRDCRAVSGVPVRPGGECDSTRQCIGESMCVFGICTCTRGLVNAGPECANPSLLGGTTRRAESMECLDGFQADRSGGCVEKGSENSEEQRTHGVTTSSVTRLPALLPALNTLKPSAKLEVHLEDKPTLRSLVSPHYQLPTLGEACEEVCRDDATCLSQICICVGEYVEWRGVCARKSEVEAAAATETFYDGDARIEMTLYGHACDAPDACPSNAFCFERFCRCMHGHRAHAGACETVVGIGGACISNAQCARAAACFEGRCACAGGVAAVAGRCPSPRLAHPGDDCARGQVCAFNAYCGLMSGVCECPGGMETREGRCEQTDQEAGDACVTSRNCHKFSYCDNGFCICKTGYVLVNGFCIPVAPLPLDSDSDSFMAVNLQTNGVDQPSFPPNRNNGPMPLRAAKMAAQAGAAAGVRFATANMLANTQNVAQPQQHQLIPLDTAPVQISPDSFAVGRPIPFRPFPGGSASREQSNNLGPAGNPSDPNLDAQQQGNSFTQQQIPMNPNLAAFFTRQQTPQIQPEVRFPSGQFGQAANQNQAQPFPRVNTFQTVFNTQDLNNFQQPATVQPTPTAAVFPYTNNIHHSFGAINPSSLLQPSGVGQTPIRFDPLTFSRYFPEGRLPGLIPSTVARKQQHDETSEAPAALSMPGEFCGDGERTCLGNAACTRKFCRCPRRSYAENGICVQNSRLLPLDEVAADEGRSVEDALGAPEEGEVDDDRASLEASDDDDEPGRRQFSAPLENCANGEFCTGGSECRELRDLGRVCQCAENHVLTNEECVDLPQGRMAVGLVEACNEDAGDLCVGGAACSNGVCACATGRLRERYGICLPLAAPGDTCERGEVCGDGSVCDDAARVCVCPEQSRSTRSGQCVSTEAAALTIRRRLPLAPGDECIDDDVLFDQDEDVIDARCGEAAACVNGVCRCADDAAPVGGRCVPTASVRAVGDACDAFTACAGGAACMDGVCACEPSQVAIDDECVEVPGVPRFSSDIRRSPQHFRSRTSDRESSVSSEEEQEEVEAATEPTTKIGTATCDVDADCPKAYNCLNQICVCNLSSVECLAEVLLNADAECRSDADCSEQASMCSNHRCVEPTKSTSIDDILSAPGAACDAEAPCGGGGVCVDSRCVCDLESMVDEESGTCIPRAGAVFAGGACGYSGHCRPELACLEGTCTCLEWTACTPANEQLTSPPGGSCSEARSCTGGAICRDGWCICPEATMVVQKGICTPNTPKSTLPPANRLSLPTFAATSRAPLPGSDSAPAGRKAIPGANCTYAKPFESCANGEECIGDSYCNDYKFCACPGSRPLVVSGACVARRVALPGDVCGDARTECAVGTTSACIDGLCRCPAGFIAVAGQCVAVPTPAPPAAASAPASRAQPPPSISAAPKHAPDAPSGSSSTMSSSRPLAGPLQNCENGEICIGGSNCDPDAGVCMCPKGQAAFGDRCAEPPAMQQLLAEAVGSSSTTEAPPPASAKLIGMPNMAPAVNILERTTRTPLSPVQAFSQLGTTAPTAVTLTTTPSSATTTSGVTTASSGPTTKRPTTTTVAPLETTITIAGCTSSDHCAVDRECDQVSGRCACRGGAAETPDGKCMPVQDGFIHHRHLLPYGQTCRPGIDNCGNGAACINDVCKCGAGEMLAATGRCAPFADVFAAFKSSEPEVTPRPEDLFGIPPAAAAAMPTLIVTTPKPLPTQIAIGERCVFDVNVCPASAHCVQGLCVCEPGYVESDGACVTAPPPAPATPIPPMELISPPPVFVPTSTPPTLEPVQILDPIQILKPTLHPTPPPIPTLALETAPIPTPAPLPTPNSPMALTPAPTPTPAPLTPEPPRRPTLSDGSCGSADDCPAGAKCIRGVCVCMAKKTLLLDGRCVPEAFARGLARPGASCAAGELCVGGAICDFDSKECACASGHVDVDGVCTSDAAAPFVFPGASCRGGERCAGGSTCTDGVCSCADDHRVSDGYCRPIAAPNDQVQFINGTGLRFKSKMSAQRPRATPCDTDKCRLPDCFCSETGRSAPGGLLPSSTPQFVVLTFDDAVNSRTLPDYRQLFENTRFKNPNGCAVKGTFFVSHEWTNYDGVQWIFANGHELASNSITHVSLADESASRWLNEIDGQRRIMAKFANAEEDEIIGMRAPQLAIGGDEMIEMMSHAGFAYDNSMSVNPGASAAPFWPQTLDHRVAFPCSDQRHCPTKSFPGVWEIPLNQFYGQFLSQIGSHQRSSMLRAAVSLNATVDELLEMLTSSLARAYTTNRAPLVLTLNADFLQLNEENTGMRALEKFIEHASLDSSIYFVTLKQLLAWMREPVALSQIAEHPSVRCARGFSAHPSGRGACVKPNKCMYRTAGLNSPEHQFLTCSPCPPLYPWIANPAGIR